MMFCDKIDDFQGKAVFMGNGDPIFHMGFDNFITDSGIQGVVGILPIVLILDIVFGLHNFPDVVIVSTGPYEKDICLDGFCGRGSKIGYGKAVIIGARTVAHVDDNIVAGDWDLSDADHDRLANVVPFNAGYPQEWIDETFPGAFGGVEFPPG